MIKIFRIALELFAWLNIFISVQAIFVIISGIIYYLMPCPLTIVITIIVLLIGFFLGIYVSERIRRTTGCSTLIFRIKSSPDLDNLKK